VPYDPAQQALIDEEHLRLLAIGYYISAGFTALYSFIGLFYAAMGGMVGFSSKPSSGTEADASAEAVGHVVGAVIVAIGVGLFLFLIALAVAKFLTARFLTQRKSRTFCFVVGIVTCLGIPYGTVLGVFTILVLERPSVRRLFDPAKFPPPPAPPSFPSRLPAQ
jgi:hypothetical protein